MFIILKTIDNTVCVKNRFQNSICYYCFSGVHCTRWFTVLSGSLYSVVHYTQLFTIVSFVSEVLLVGCSALDLLQLFSSVGQ